MPRAESSKNSPVEMPYYPSAEANVPPLLPGPRPKKYHICTVCERSFSTTGHLARHSRIHSGEKNYACPFPGCSTRCSRQDNLQQHYRIHIAGGSRRASSKRNPQPALFKVEAIELSPPPAAPSPSISPASVSALDFPRYPSPPNTPPALVPATQEAYMQYRAKNSAVIPSEDVYSSSFNELPSLSIPPPLALPSQDYSSYSSSPSDSYAESYSDSQYSIGGPDSPKTHSSSPISPRDQMPSPVWFRSEAGEMQQPQYIAYPCKYVADSSKSVFIASYSSVEETATPRYLSSSVLPLTSSHEQETSPGKSLHYLYHPQPIIPSQFYHDRRESF